MVTKYKVVYWEFDTQRFSEHLLAWCTVIGVKDVAQVLDISTATLTSWTKGKFDASYPYPHMVNFLRACNELSLDPRDFFTTSE